MHLSNLTLTWDCDNPECRHVFPLHVCLNDGHFTPTVCPRCHHGILAYQVYSEAESERDALLEAKSRNRS